MSDQCQCLASRRGGTRQNGVPQRKVHARENWFLNLVHSNRNEILQMGHARKKKISWGGLKLFENM